MKNFILIKKLLIAVFALVISMSINAQGQLYFEENFEYTVGDLPETNWNPVNSGNPITIESGSLSYTNYLSSGIGNKAKINVGLDYSRQITSTTSGSVYAAALINVTSAKAGGEYVMHFIQSGTIYKGRVFIKSNGDGFSFGVAKSGTTPAVNYTTEEYNFGETYLVVLKYTFNSSDDVVELFINPEIGTAEPSATLTAADNSTADATSISAFALRQPAASSAPELFIDGIRVATSWDEAVKEDNSTEISLSITSPEDNSTVNENQVSVQFTVRNFVLGENDGKVAYKLGESGTVNYATASPILIENLVIGANTIYLELVDENNDPLTEPVVAQVTVNYEELLPTIAITSPEDGSTIYSQDINISFTVENFVIGENDGKIKVTLDNVAQAELHESVNNINLTGLSYGEHTVILELVNNDGTSLDTPVTDEVTFTYAEPQPTIEIINPEDGSTIYSQDIVISFTIENFVIGENDGKIKITLDNVAQAEFHESENDINLTGLSYGEHTVILELVNNDGTSLDTPVTDEVTFTCSAPQPTIEITNPDNGSTIYSQDVDISFTVENFVIGENDGKIKITLDNVSQTELHESVNDIDLTGLSYGEHTVILELVNNDGTSLDTPVTDEVTFTCAEPITGGMETFTNCEATTTYANSSFIGDNGITWTYGHSRNEGDYAINGKGLMLRRGSDSYIQSETLSGGIGRFEVKMRKAFAGNALRQLELYINDELKGVSETFGDSQGEDATIRTFSIDIMQPGDFVIKIKPAGTEETNQQITIDDILWTAFDDTEPYITITSPENNSEVTTDEVVVEFTVSNFEIGSEAGKVEWSLNADQSGYVTSSPVNISGLREAGNVIRLQLLNNDNTPLDPPVWTMVTVLYNPIAPEISVLNPSNGATIYSQNVDIEFEVEDFEIGGTNGKVKYTIDGGNPVYVTASPIALTNLSYGEHTVTLELVNNDQSSLNPAVTTSVTFTCAEVADKTYRLVTANSEINENGEYLLVGIKDDSHYALGWQKTNNRHAVVVNEEGNVIMAQPAHEVTAEQDNVSPYEIKFVETTSGYALLDNLNNKYLRPRTGDNSGLQLAENQVEWTVSVDAEGKASIVCTDQAYVRNTMRFNKNGSNDPLFACYVSGQDDVYIYKAFTNPYFQITSPENNAVVNVNEVTVTFSISNFILGTDGKIAYRLNGTLVDYTTSRSILISSLREGSNVINLQLVNMSNQPISGVDAQEVTVIYEVEPELEPKLTITSPEDDSEISSSTVDIVFVTEDFVLGTDGKVKYTVNSGEVSYTTSSPINLTQLENGNYDVVLELVDMNNNSLDPEVVTSVSFTITKVGITSEFINGVNIYPNPASDNINIELTEKVDKISVMNIVGQTIYEVIPTSENQVINVSEFNSGIYFIMILKSGINETYKIIVE